MAGVRTSISMSTRVCVGICSIDHVQIGRKGIKACYKHADNGLFPFSLSLQ